jgi:hypothetical protein
MHLSSHRLRVSLPGAVGLLVLFCFPLASVAGMVSQTGCGYSSGVSPGGTYDGISWHCTSVNGFDTTVITASAFAQDQSPYWASGQYWISDTADLDATIFTSGPVRSGFMQITASSDSEFGSISEQVGSWSCAGPGTPCFSSGNQYLPVTLGVPLELAIRVTYGGETGSALGTIGLSLFEATTYTPPFLGSGVFGDSLPLVPGDAVVLLAAPPAPEPGTVLLLVVGFSVFWIKAPGIRMLCRGTSAFFRST